jgi:MFS family permease
MASGRDGSVAPPMRLTRGQVTAAVIGNALEFYDFTVYSVFAVDIGNAFFPNETAFVKLMASLLTFGVGFVTRPIGAVVIGRIADRIGRRTAMLISFALMGLAIVGLASTPSYAAIGAAAPVLAVAFRMIQGFALGGELGPVMAFLVEAAPPGRRGFFGSWQSASQSMASLIGGLVGAAVVAALGEQLAGVYGWRIAFWLGALVLPFGLVIRRALPETLHHHEEPSAAHPESASLLAHAWIILLGVGVIACFTTTTYVRLYMTTYARTTLHMPVSAANIASAVNGVAGVVFTVLGGWLSDRFGRKPAMIWPLVGYLLVILPAFYLIVRNGDAPTLWTSTAVISAMSSLSTGAALVWLSEAMRKEIRGLAVGGVYAFTVASFGGATQPLLAWLIETTHQPLAPAFYLMVTTLIGLAAMFAMTETAPHHIRVRSEA